MLQDNRYRDHTAILFPDKEVGYGPERSNPIFAKAYGGISVICKGGLTDCLLRIWHIMHSEM